MSEIKILSIPINIQACIDKILTPQSGGIDVFIGIARDSTKGRAVKYLEYEAYESMAIKEMQKIADESFKKWPVQNILIHHRTGILSPGETAVVIAVSAAHRDAAFDACRFIIETLKKTVPIWKKEIFVDGVEWVSPNP